MTTVSDLLRNSNCDAVLAEIRRVYPTTPDASIEGYRRVWEELLATKPESSDLTCELYHDGPAPFVAVHGRDSDGTAWGIEYMSWDQWLGMNVSTLPEVGDISQTEVLAHILWEMTWAGFSNDEIQKKANAMMDSVPAPQPDSRWMGLGGSDR